MLVETIAVERRIGERFMRPQVAMIKTWAAERDAPGGVFGPR